MSDNKTLARLASAGLATALVAASTAASSAALHVTVFNPGKAAIHPVTSSTVYGPHEAMLVNAQFQKRYATTSSPSESLPNAC